MSTRETARRQNCAARAEKHPLPHQTGTVTSVPPSPAGVEIERKFLVEEFDPSAPSPGADGNGPLWRGTPVVQVYLATGNPELRLRSANGKVTLGAKRGQGLVRQEAEALVDTASAAPLLAILSGSGSFPVVRKTRYKTAESSWEVDVYTARSYSGLVVAEIELSGEDEPLPPLPPGLVLGREVTGEAAWANQSLALFEGDALTPDQEKHNAAALATAHGVPPRTLLQPASRKANR